MSFVRRTAAVLAALVMASTLAACGDDGPEPPVAQAVAYDVVRVDDISFPGRTRLQAWIVAPTADTRDELAHTAMKAAIDLYERQIPRLSAVVLLDKPDGQALATADYANDGKGIDGKTPLANTTWQIEAIDPPASVTLTSYTPQ